MESSLNIIFYLKNCSSWTKEKLSQFCSEERLVSEKIVEGLVGILESVDVVPERVKGVKFDQSYKLLN